jgi:hypothetical protein
MEMLADSAEALDRARCAKQLGPMVPYGVERGVDRRVRAREEVQRCHFLVE